MDHRALCYCYVGIRDSVINGVVKTCSKMYITSYELNRAFNSIMMVEGEATVFLLVGLFSEAAHLFIITGS